MTEAAAVSYWVQAFLGLVIMTDFSLLVAERQRLSIRLIGIQGMILGFLPMLVHSGETDAHLIAVTCLFFGIKGILLPYLLRRTYLQLPPQPPSRPYLGNAMSVLIGLLGLAVSFWLSSRLETTANELFSLFFPPAFATIFAGLLLIVARRRALSQMFGYLVLENGIYLLGVPMAQNDALWLELTVLLDILVGAFVMGIAIYHINRAFHSTDVDHFASLKD